MNRQMRERLFEEEDIDPPQTRVHRALRDGFNPVQSFTPKQVYATYKFTPRCIYYLCDLVMESMARPTNRGHSLPVMYLVLAGLFYLTTPSHMIVVANAMRVDKSTVSRAVWQFCSAVIEHVQTFVVFPAGQFLEETKVAFQEVANLPEIIGCVDGTLIEINRPRQAEKDLVGFAQFLVNGGLQASTIRTKLSSLKSCFNYLGLNTHLADSPVWGWNATSIDRTYRKMEDGLPTMTMHHLLGLCDLCDQSLLLKPFKVALTWGFFGLFRVSNMFPNSSDSFDAARNTRLKDVWWHQDGLIVKIRWTKSAQNSGKATAVPLPALQSNKCCPVQAWLEYEPLRKKITSDPDSPLLLDGLKGRPLSADNFRTFLHAACRKLNIMQYGYTPHALRRGGTCFLAAAGVSEQGLKDQGGWSSNCYRLYLKGMRRMDTEAAKVLKNLDSAKFMH